MGLPSRTPLQCTAKIVALPDQFSTNRSGAGMPCPTQGLAITVQCVVRVDYARLACHPLLQQGLEGPYIQLSELQSEGGV